MKYVKHFTINGIDTTQVGCIELNGRPNAATAGAVGLLGIDVTSATHDVYKCVAVNGSIYTWELLSSGMSVLSANITGEGGQTKTFPYSDIRIPDNYLIKRGDLILDSEGYLYQISAIGNESCDTTYTSVHLTGGNGGKDYKLQIVDGKLQLVTENGAVMSTVDYPINDNISVVSDIEGKTKVIGVYTINDSLLRFFVGTQAEYEAVEDKENIYPILKDAPTFTQLKDTINVMINYYKGVRKTAQGTVRYDGATFGCTITITDDSTAGTVTDVTVDKYTGFTTIPGVAVDGNRILISGDANPNTICSATVSYLLSPNLIGD